jgi:uncharacterized membrane protein YoaK (UPF0700 family)
MNISVLINKSNRLTSIVSEEIAVLMMAFCGGFVGNFVEFKIIFICHVIDSCRMIAIADAAGYVRLFGIFTSSITGNLIVATTNFNSNTGFQPRALCSLLFTISGGVSSAVAASMKYSQYSKKVIAVLLFLLELICLIAAIITGLLLENDLQDANIDSPSVLIQTLILACAMGFQCGAVKDSFATAPATTVMTSNLINFSTLCSQALASLLCIHPDLVKSTIFKKLGSATLLLLFFIGGAICGSLSCVLSALSWWCLAIPAGIVLLLIVDVLIQAAPTAVVVPEMSPSASMPLNSNP